MICDEDTDCIHGHCSAQFRCSGENKLMDNDCLCFFNSECHSGRCEGVRRSVCEAKLGEGSYCSESSDCLSNQCTWSFHCAASPTAPSELEMEIAGSERLGYSQVSTELHPIRGFILCFLLVGGMTYRWSKMRSRRNGYDRIPLSSAV
jgi:hypothetical protein